MFCTKWPRWEKSRTLRHFDDLAISAQAILLSTIGAPSVGAPKVALALDALIFAVDASRHGATLGPSAIFDAPLKDMRREYESIRAMPIGIIGGPL